MRKALLVGLLLVVGCGSSGTGATCPSNNTLTYENFGRQFFASYCDRCHSSTQPVMNSLATIRANSTMIDSEAAAGPNGTNTAMPEGTPAPTTAERTQLGQWLACGAP